MEATVFGIGTLVSGPYHQVQSSPEIYQSSWALQEQSLAQKHI